MGAGLGIGTGVAVGNAVLGIAQGNKANQRTRDNMRLGAELSKEQTEFNRGQQMQLWKDTNYGAQVAEMEKAGLNVGMMYGGSGSGGTTALATGSVSGGAGQAAGMDIGSSIMKALEMENMAAQKELIKAQTEKTLTEAEKIGGVDTDKTVMEVQSLSQGINNAKALEQVQIAEGSLKRIAEAESDMSRGARMDLIETEAKKAKESLRSMTSQADVDSKVVDEKIKIFEQQAIGSVIENTAKRMGIEVQKAQIGKMAADISQGWESLSIQDRNTRIGKFKAELEAQYPALDKIPGRMWNEFMLSIDELLGWGEEAERLKQKVK